MTKPADEHYDDAGCTAPDTCRAKPAGILAVDIDGTLITNEGEITDRVFDALTRADEAGWEVVVATGRTYFATRDIIERLPFVRHAVLSNGALILDTRTLVPVLHRAIKPDVVRTILETVRHCGCVPALYDMGITDQKIYYDTLEGTNDYFHSYVTTDPRCEKVDDVMDHTDAILQIAVIAGHARILAIRDALDGCGATALVMPFEGVLYGGRVNGYWFLQVMGAQTGKHNALRQLADELGAPPDRLVAVGDNYNDADMITHADIGVAMGNAPEEIRCLAKVVVGTNTKSGLADAVDDILLSGRYFPESNGEECSGDGQDDILGEGDKKPRG